TLKFPEFNQSMKDFYGKKYLDIPYKDFKKKAIEVILSKLLKNYAISQNIHKNKRFIIKWQSAQTNIEDKNNSRIVEYMINHEIRKDAQMTKFELKSYYIKHRHEYQKPTLYKLRKLIFSDEQRAKQIYKHYKLGKPIEQLTRKYSEEKYSEVTSGVTNYLSSKEIGKHFDKISNINIGDVLEPLSENDKYVIYQLMDKQIGATPSFNTIEEDIKKGLFKEKIEDWIDAKIELKNWDIKKYYDKL
ncbi:MAG: peptidyl-prolyl cis-trans isomerase, partial [Candidatus Cloacimonadota bacterium]|nr:peptidyl-prolyl cis-trans isomerase [Candidatus Cloacimonadota bacterium]